jgi:molybdenum cofactor biosynthesis protein B
MGHSWNSTPDPETGGLKSMSRSVDEHRSAAQAALGLGVLTVSDTRTRETDSSGALIISLAEAAGHHIIERAIVPDEPVQMRPILLSWAANSEIEAILITGGTGISPRDQTFETVTEILTKPLPGFGELFRMLSFSDIGPAAILSRAVGGLVEDTPILVMPGSRAAVELAMTRIVLPELPHLVREARKR